MPSNEANFWCPAKRIIQIKIELFFSIFRHGEINNIENFELHNTGVLKTFNFQQSSNTKVNTMSESMSKEQCKICKKVFTDSIWLNNHINKIHGIKMSETCDSCGKSFSSAEDLKTHIDTIHEVQQDHKRESIIMADENKERKVPFHKCYICDKYFDQQFSLEEHNFTFHNNEATEESTNIHNINKVVISKRQLSSKSLSAARPLKKHKQKFQQSHEGLNCGTCNKSFFQRQNLKKHIHTVHEGHKDYKCESCGKSFSLANGLKGHINTVHGGGKDYKCEFCGKSFTQVGSLNRHIHTFHS